MIVLIPAYEPAQHLVELVRNIRTRRPAQQIVLVDDGSGPAYAPIFTTCRSLGCDVVTHEVNRGKGAALKTGFAHIEARYPGRNVVCADCDGQHTLADIVRVSDEVARQRDAIVLGARHFAGDVPFRSRFGNDVTRAVFRLATGIRLQDTQTGLRGYPASMLGWLQTVDGDRFEYELDALLQAKRDGFRFHEVPIETIYLAGNESSHFHPIKDSIRVYVPFVRFALSSLVAFAVDAVLLFTLMALTGHLLGSVVLARLGSATVNYLANRRMVFGHRERVGRSAWRYGALVVCLLAANYALLATLTGTVGMHLLPAKVITEVVLFVASYQAQRRLVFRAGRSRTVATVDQLATVGVPASDTTGSADVTVELPRPAEVAPPSREPAVWSVSEPSQP